LIPPHEFIFKKGIWIGEGKITFSVSPDHLHFYTKWMIDPMVTTVIRSQQLVEMEGRAENLFNQFNFSHITEKDFQIQLSSELLGSVTGKGIVDKRTIAWEFRGYPDFEGFEVYELEDNGDYMLHAEYSSTEQFRTIIDGRIWKKAEK